MVKMIEVDEYLGGKCGLFEDAVFLIIFPSNVPFHE